MRERAHLYASHIFSECDVTWLVCQTRRSVSSTKHAIQQTRPFHLILNLSVVFMFENHVTELDREYLKWKQKRWQYLFEAEFKK
jgi:hypothetical protein